MHLCLLAHLSISSAIAIKSDELFEFLLSATSGPPRGGGHGSGCGRGGDGGRGSGCGGGGGSDRSDVPQVLDFLLNRK